MAAYNLTPIGILTRPSYIGGGLLPSDTLYPSIDLVPHEYPTLVQTQVSLTEDTNTITDSSLVAFLKEITEVQTVVDTSQFRFSIDVVDSILVSQTELIDLKALYVEAAIPSGSELFLIQIPETETTVPSSTDQTTLVLKTVEESATPSSTDSYIVQTELTESGSLSDVPGNITVVIPAVIDNVAISYSDLLGLAIKESEIINISSSDLVIHTIAEHIEPITPSHSELLNLLLPISDSRSISDSFEYNLLIPHTEASTILHTELIGVVVAEVESIRATDSFPVTIVIPVHTEAATSSHSELLDLSILTTETVTVTDLHLYDVTISPHTDDNTVSHTELTQTLVPVSDTISFAESTLIDFSALHVEAPIIEHSDVTITESRTTEEARIIDINLYEIFLTPIESITLGTSELLKIGIVPDEVTAASESTLVNFSTSHIESTTAIQTDTTISQSRGSDTITESSSDKVIIRAGDYYETISATESDEVIVVIREHIESSQAQHLDLTSTSFMIWQLEPPILISSSDSTTIVIPEHFEVGSLSHSELTSLELSESDSTTIDSFDTSIIVFGEHVELSSIQHSDLTITSFQEIITSQIGVTELTQIITEHLDSNRISHSEFIDLLLGEYEYSLPSDSDKVILTLLAHEEALLASQTDRVKIKTQIYEGSSAVDGALYTLRIKEHKEHTHSKHSSLVNLLLPQTDTITLTASIRDKSNYFVARIDTPRIWHRDNTKTRFTTFDSATISDNPGQAYLVKHAILVDSNRLTASEFTNLFIQQSERRIRATTSTRYALYVKAHEENSAPQIGELIKLGVRNLETAPILEYIGPINLRVRRHIESIRARHSELIGLLVTSSSSAKASSSGHTILQIAPHIETGTLSHTILRRARYVASGLDSTTISDFVGPTKLKTEKRDSLRVSQSEVISLSILARSIVIPRTYTSFKLSISPHEEPIRILDNQELFLYFGISDAVRPEDDKFKYLVYRRGALQQRISFSEQIYPSDIFSRLRTVYAYARELVAPQQTFINRTFDLDQYFVASVIPTDDLTPTYISGATRDFDERTIASDIATAIINRIKSVDLSENVSTSDNISKNNTIIINLATNLTIEDTL